MDCRCFKKHHLAYLDDTLPGVDIVAMERHLLECEQCARFDTAVRRGLLLFKNLPPIEPSPDFAARLNARLREVGAGAAAGADGDVFPDDAPASWREALQREERAPGRLPWRAPRLGSWAAAAAVALVLGYGVTTAYDRFGGPEELRLAPVVATRPEPAPTPTMPMLASHALMTSVSTALPVWPTALLAEEAPMHFMSTEFQLTSYTR
jgi:hypothetical protein